MISGYNSQPYFIKNLELIIGKEIKLSGFIVLSLDHKYEEEFYRDFPRMIANGEVKYKEDRAYGLEHSGQAILDVQKGHNSGKKVIVVAEE